MTETPVVFHDGSVPDDIRTHVLIVAVGHYRYFNGGGAQSNEASDLGQLDSPPTSAKALADWFISQYHYPDAPLGTLSLLSSEEQIGDYHVPNGPGKPLWPADYDMFADAAYHWCTLGANERSRLIFIFCGHGFGYGPETSLLMGDFDFRKRNCWDSALDLGSFIAGMEEVPAAEQIFFIDACRKSHPAQLRPGASIGRAPIQVRSGDPRQGLARRNAPVFFSTGDAQPARGRVGGVSVFTEAFLHAMEGMAAREDTGDWRVNSYSLLEAMDHVSKRLTEAHFPQPQQPQGTEARLFSVHHLRQDPVSPVYVKRDDAVPPCGPAHLHYEVGGVLHQRACTDQDQEVEVRLPLGKYNFDLVTGTGLVVASATQKAAPTYREAVLK